MNDVQERWDACMVPNYGAPELLLRSGRGAYVMDQAGRAYLDLVAGVAVNALGHGHPGIVAAVQQQVERLAHTSNLYAHTPGMALAERLQQQAGGHKALFLNSGTEANEAALKLCRRHAHQEGRDDSVVLAFTSSFHGRTTGALALTGQPHHQASFEPFPGQVVHVPFNDVEAYEAALDSHDVSAVFTECIQGEGGVRPMSEALGASLRRTTGKDRLLVVDEVQTGVARTGTFFAHTQWDLKPQVITLAKGLGGGLPIGACLVQADLAPVLGPGTHGCTFGGNPISAAAAHAVLDAVEQDNLEKRAARLGRRAQAIAAEAGQELRGRGLLRGLDVDDAAAAVARMREARVLVGQAGKQVVRLCPPLVVPEGPWADAVTRLVTPVPAVTVA